jgi:RHS repeat-associated protein
VSGPATASIGRDGRNRDVKRTINGVTTYLIYDGWNLVAEYNGAGVLTTQYIHGPQVDEILAKATPTSTTFPLPDALGSTIAVTDQSGALMERVYYSDAFGTPTFKNGSGATLAGTTTGTRFLFTGREWLSQFGLYDYRNRTYSAAFGRFIEKDPIGFRAGDLNLYRYVSNNAVNLVDPWGLEVTCAQIGDTYYISEKDGEKYEVNRRLWRAGALINLISKRFQPIPDGVDIFIVKWGQAYYTIKQEIFRCKDTCSGEAWIEKRRDRVAGSERVEYSYSLDFDADLGGSGPVGGA